MGESRNLRKGERKVKKILIANRGEIALRIIHTCKQMGIETVAVYSDADAELPYVQAATKAHRIGEPPVQKSYLNVEELLRISHEEKVDAIHPGYGFLSENSAFAKRAIDEGFCFIGPSPEIISIMGDKIAARAAMKEAGVPVVPGSEGDVTSVEEACKVAGMIGYPVMLKASGGGGGIGMVRCNNEDAVKQVYASTKARAKAYFGHEGMFIEKLIVNARHIEVQVFGDQHGNIVHLFERDCSVQRRNQKVIEEAPALSLKENTRQAMQNQAVQAAKAIGYYNAGTVEFIVDEEENFYFLEMNTRLQVEHPITEQIAGVDLVKWQILAARGEKLPRVQEEIAANNYAIEFRIYAEDPFTFLPAPGKITGYHLPERTYARVDSGYRNMNAVTPFYDPMIAKVIITGRTRSNAIELAKSYFTEAVVEGIKTNIPLFKQLLNEELYEKGVYNTSLLPTVLNKGGAPQ